VAKKDERKKNTSTAKNPPVTITNKNGWVKFSNVKIF